MFVLDARVAVHAGPVVGAVVETSKLSYDVYGDTMKTLLAVLHAARDGEITVSDAARRLAGDGFAWADLDAADTLATRSERRYYRIDGLGVASVQA